VFEDILSGSKMRRFVGPRDDAHVNRAAWEKYLVLTESRSSRGSSPFSLAAFTSWPEPLCDLGRGERLVVLEAVGRHYRSPEPVDGQQRGPPVIQEAGGRSYSWAKRMGHVEQVTVPRNTPRRWDVCVSSSSWLCDSSHLFPVPSAMISSI